jgi:hypothetical protein
MNRPTARRGDNSDRKKQQRPKDRHIAPWQPEPPNAVRNCGQPACQGHA